MKRKTLAKELVILMVLQINELSKILKEKYGTEDISLTTKHEIRSLTSHGLKHYKLELLIQEFDQLGALAELK